MDLLTLADAFAAGIGLGIVYCAVLWFVVRRLVASRRPALWLIGTAIPRIAVILGGIYWVMDGRWERLIACMVGFVLARFVIQRWVISPVSSHPAAS